MVLRSTVQEPDPWSACPHEQMAREREQTEAPPAPCFDSLDELLLELATGPGDQDHQAAVERELARLKGEALRG